MEWADLSFEEAKLRIVGKLKKLKDLDDMRRKLNEQLFILDLQQEVSIKRYKRYLQMIGEHQQKENNRYISSQSFDDSDSYRSNDTFLKYVSKEIPILLSQKVEDKKLNETKEKLAHYKNFINQKKEIYFNLSKQDALIENIFKMVTHVDPSNNKRTDFPNNNSEDTQNKKVDYSLQLEDLLGKINDQKIKKAKLQVEKEGLFREVTSLVRIEKEMQNQLLILQKQAFSLVGKRKWHPNFENSNIQKNRNYTIFNTSLSIP